MEKYLQISAILHKKTSDPVVERHGSLPNKLEMNEISRDLALFFVVFEFNFGSFGVLL